MCWRERERERERVEMKTEGREIEKTALLFSELQKQTNKEIKEKTVKKGTLRFHDVSCIRDIDRSRFMYV